ncbi:MAG: hypothetical protein U0U09_00270 [Cyclobacteriaceae bacterium]
MKTLSVNSPELRKFLKYVTLLLLILNGIGALVGGIPMIAYPDGSANGIPLSYLEHSPFTNYLIPGLVLVTCNGVLSMLVFLALVLNVRHHSWFVLGQGGILLGWIVIQMIMLREVNFLQISFGSIGVALMVLGRYLGRFEWR